METKDVAAVEDNEGLLRSLGIDASVSGNDCVTVRALPEILGNVNPAALLEEIVALTRSLTGRTEEIVESILQTMACHGSIRAGRVLEREEMAALLRELQAVDFSTHCPHGRPVHFSLSRREIEGKLGRK
jgi:DNA mismatch repair protein MutL